MTDKKTPIYLEDLVVLFKNVWYWFCFSLLTVAILWIQFICILSMKWKPELTALCMAIVMFLEVTLIGAVCLTFNINKKQKQGELR